MPAPRPPADAPASPPGHAPAGPPADTSARPHGQNLTDLPTTPLTDPNRHSPGEVPTERAPQQTDPNRHAPGQPPAERAAPQTAPNRHASDPAERTTSERNDGTPDDPMRLGAHAAPYMDPDGTLHNVRPIARLSVSGPDPRPARVADTEFGGKWFAAKVEASEPTVEAQPAAGGIDGDTRPMARDAGAERPGRRSIDLDVTGLFNAMAAADQNHPAAGGGDEAAAVQATIIERMAAPVSPAPHVMPEQPEVVRPSLSAADLEAIRWRLDGATLREVVDDREALRELGERLDEPLADEVDTVAKAGLLSVRAEVWRLLGELGMAAAASRLALAHAESARDVQSMVIAQAELAHILRLRGDFKEADRLFARATGAAVPETLRSVVHENAGRSCFDQGRHMEALDHFARAVRLGRSDDAELAARIGVCLEAVYIHVLRDGWGPYPRRREDILGVQSRPAAETKAAEAKAAEAKAAGTKAAEAKAAGTKAAEAKAAEAKAAEAAETKGAGTRTAGTNATGAKEHEAAETRPDAFDEPTAEQPIIQPR